jgi:zinc protease
MRWSPLFLTLAACAVKPVAPEATAPDSAIIPLNPDVRTGVLPNGLTWYVLPNAWPEDRAELRLVVGVGSVVEDEDQLGLAHFLEHMAFNGTERFPGNDLVTWLEGLGIKFGAHLNASTGFDTTTYMLRVPTDKPEDFDRALQVLDDWASAVTLAPEEIDKERGVVLEEWRTRLGLGSRLTEAQLPVTFEGSRYADRLPIGTEESLKTFSHDAIRRFYDTWYRPDLMSVVVVGDVDPDRVAAQIEAMFRDNTNPAGAPARPRFDLPPIDPPRGLVTTDPEMTRNQVGITVKRDGVEATTVALWREKIAEELVWAVLNERLGALSKQPDAPWYGAGGGASQFNPTEQMINVGADVREGMVLQAVEALAVEVERMKRYGVTAAERERAAAERSRAMEVALSQKDRTDSAGLANELVRRAVTGESVLGIEAETALTKETLASLTDAELAEAARTFMDGSRIVAAILPEKDGLVPPTEADLVAAWDRGAAGMITAPDAGRVEGPLVATTPVAGKVTERGVIAELGVTTWTLSNGATVWLLPNDNEPGRVRMAAVSPGGLSLVPDDVWASARVADTIAASSGLGAFNQIDLGRRLAGVSASISPWIGRFHEGLNGSAAVEEQETMLQLLHLVFTEPRLDDDAWVIEKRGIQASIDNRDRDPGTAASDAFTKLMWGGHPRYQPWTTEALDAVSVAKAKEAYKARFSGVDDFTFIFVGSIDPVVFEPLVTTWIGGLPGGVVEKPGDDKARRAEGVHQETVRAGLEAKSNVRMTMYGPFDGDPFVDGVKLDALVEVLRVRLREELRERLGGVYGVSVGANLEQLPSRGYTLSVSYTCDPERVDELRAATEAVFKEVQAAPVDATYVDTIKAQYLRSYETSLKNNGWWLGQLSSAVRDGDDPKQALAFDEVVATLDNKVVQEAAKRWLNAKSRVEVVLLPEGT